MEWRDEGIIIGVRGHGETSAIVEAFTPSHGRCLGLVRGGRSRRLRPVLQAGNTVGLHWHARLEEHLGTFQVEPLRLDAGAIMDCRFTLAGLSTVAALAQLLPERDPHPRLYDASQVLLSSFADDDVWPALLVRWELGLLEELGFGLDLSKCAATGSRDNLGFVSPRSGRAISLEAGRPYEDKLFVLPTFLKGDCAPAPQDVALGLTLTGHFLERHLFGPRGLTMPLARQWLAEELSARMQRTAAA